MFVDANEVIMYQAGVEKYRFDRATYPSFWDAVVANDGKVRVGTWDWNRGLYTDFKVASQWTPVASLGDVSSHVVTGLTNDTTYALHLTKNTNENSPQTTIAATTLEWAGPPDDLAVTAQTVDSVSLTWTEGYAGDTQPSPSYRVMYRLQGGTYTTVLTSNTSYVVDNLLSFTTYDFKVTKVVDFIQTDVSLTSAVVSATTLRAAAQPAAWTTPFATTETTVELVWTLTSDGNTPTTEYRIQQSADQSTWVTVETADPIGPSVLTYTVSELTASTTLYFRVVKVNANDGYADVVSEIASATTSDPAPVAPPAPVADPSMVIKMNSGMDGSNLIDWDQIILRDNNGSVVEYDVDMNPSFSFHSHTDRNTLSASSYPNHPLHHPWRNNGSNQSGRVIWYGSRRPTVGATLLTLFPQTQVSSMQLITYKGNRSRNVDLEVTYNGAIYIISKSTETANLPPPTIDREVLGLIQIHEVGTRQPVPPVLRYVFDNGSVEEEIEGTLNLETTYPAFTFDDHPVNTGTQAMKTNQSSNFRFGLPNGIASQMPTSNFSIRTKLYYERPSNTPPNIDTGIFFEYYARNNAAETSSIKPTSDIRVFFNAGNQRLYANVKMDGINSTAYSNGSSAWGLNQTGFKTIVIVVDSVASELRVYVNGSLLITNTKPASMDFANGLGSTNYSPLMITAHARSGPNGQMYLQSTEIFDYVLEGDDLL